MTTEGAAGHNTGAAVQRPSGDSAARCRSRAGALLVGLPGALTGVESYFSRTWEVSRSLQQEADQQEDNTTSADRLPRDGQARVTLRHTVAVARCEGRTAKNQMMQRSPSQGPRRGQGTEERTGSNPKMQLPTKREELVRRELELGLGGGWRVTLPTPSKLRSTVRSVRLAGSAALAGGGPRGWWRHALATARGLSFSCSRAGEPPSCGVVRPRCCEAKMCKAMVCKAMVCEAKVMERDSSAGGAPHGERLDPTLIVPRPARDSGPVQAWHGMAWHGI
ncbi:unnamed protein product [Diplocarpon coronariae]